VYMMVQRAPFAWTHRHVGLLVLFVMWLTLMEMDLYQNVAPYYPQGQVPVIQVTLKAVDNVRDLILGRVPPVNGPVQAGGGLVGAVLFAVCHYLFSDLGTYLVLVVSALVGAALVTQKSLVAGVQRGTRWMERRLEGLWRGSKQYVEVLFGQDKAAPDSKSPVGQGQRRNRRQPELVLEGEVVAEERHASRRGRAKGEPGPGEQADGAKPSAAWSAADAGQRPVIRDFSLRLQEQAKGAEPVAADDTAPWEVQIEQVGNQIVARYPERLSVAPAAAGDGAARLSQEEAGWASWAAAAQTAPYELPPLRLFALPKPVAGGFDLHSAQENARKLETTFESFGVQARVLEISRGPAVTRYEIQPAVGVKVARIVSLADDIALALAARDIRIEAPVPGKPVIGIEVPNEEVAVVTLREVLESPEFQHEPSPLSLALGRDISGAPIVGNLQKMPHLLVAGATGSGKSVCINGMIASILVKAKPDEVKFLMIDPKMVELSVYNGIPHLMAPVVTDPRKAAWA
ncbi:MAG: cell division protein FtsK, partial [Alicyclobacillus sp.]|nr:cell division protein FtsK [Alicyclobacillus sp.]